jgi:N-methylhydantoinase A
MALSTSWQAAIDIGGTFTDLLLVDRSTGSFVIEKVLTTPGDPSRGVRDGLDAALGRSGAAGSELSAVVHATTLVTNAVIERKGSPTALLITEGFRDTLLIGREHRYDMYDVRLEKPAPLVRRRDTYAVPERVLADGTVLRQLDEDAVARVAVTLRERETTAVAVCLLHAYRFPEHELRVREILRDCAPDIRVALSHEVAGELREYERASTTVANAYVLDLVDRYLGRLEEDLRNVGFMGRLFVMLSGGGIASPETARRFPVRLIESGPAAGALAAAESGSRSGRLELLSFDMGGTTAKACIIEGGRPSVAGELEVARLRRFSSGSGIPLQVSSVELIEIGAGGGSLARIDRFGLVQVGPESAGSDPGPVCYGRGGSTATVTDADLLLGYLDPDYFLGGRMRLHVASARSAVEEQVALPLGLDAARAAWVVHEMVNENMANAARVHAVERGVDLRGLPLFAFGGAGPVHADRVARSLGSGLMIAPLGAGIGSTIGLLAAPLAFDLVRSAVALLADVDWTLAQQLVRDLEREGRNLLRGGGVADDEITVEHAADMRLVGQAHEITVPLPAGDPRAGDEERLRDAFGHAYTRLFGRQPPDVQIELVSWRVRTSGPRPQFPFQSGSRGGPAGDPSTALKGHRPAFFRETDGYTSTAVYDRYRLAPGMTLSGPAIVEERESTLVIGPGARGTVDEQDNVLVELPGS